jgi:hypothetical protein
LYQSWREKLISTQTKGKTLEEISIIFGDPVGFTTDGPGESGEKRVDEHIEFAGRDEKGASLKSA